MDMPWIIGAVTTFMFFVFFETRALLRPSA